MSHRRLARLMSVVGALTSALAAMSSIGCSGKIDQPGEVSDAPQFPRLTHTQWENTVTDLFRLEESPGLASSFLPDPPLGRFDNNVARLGVTSGLRGDYQRAAEAIAETVVGDQALLAAITDGESAEAFISSFGRRAFRRPLTSAESARYTTLFAKGSIHYPALGEFQAGARLVIEGLLQSPHFLYRSELTGLEEAGVHALTGYEVASRLSYAFWNTMPDDALLAAAAAGELGSADQVREAAVAMIDDPRARAQFAHFHFQSFEMRDYLDLDKNTDIFPNWRREIGASMKTEAELFLGDVLFGGGGLSDLLTSRRAFVDADLATIYGIEGDFSADFVEVELDPSRRAGFLTRAGFLAKNATLTEPDPIHRGVFVNLNLLCRDLPAVPELPDDLNPVGDTNRERVNSLTGPGTCGSGCHSLLINPIGFALENYDALGQWRESDNGFPIDAADTYQFEDGTQISFTDGIDLSEQLANSPAVHGCYVKQLTEYIFGRDLSESDDATIRALTDLSQKDALPLREILIELASGDAFRFRSTSKEAGR